MKYKVKYKGVSLLRNNRANWFIYFFAYNNAKKGGYYHWRALYTS